MHWQLFPFRPLHAAAMMLCAALSAPASAGDPSAFVHGLSDLPPESQIEIVRIVLNDLFGTPEEVRVNFAAACEKRKAPGKQTAEKKTAEPLGALLRSRVSGASREATLMALCAAPVRTRIEAVLVQETKIAKRKAAAEAGAAK